MNFNNILIIELFNSEISYFWEISFVQILIDYLNLAYFIFFLGLTGVLFNYKNLLVTMLNIELLYFGLVCLCVLSTALTFNTIGYLYALTILILAACESAVGLGMLIVLFHYSRGLDFVNFQELRG